MDMKIGATLCALLLTACDKQSEVFPADEPSLLNRVDSCDLREVFGTCVVYDLSEMGNWYVEYVERACPRNRRGDIFGEYKKSFICPPENRIARCEGIVEDPSERYEYDKHYYAGTAEHFSWRPADVQVTCEHVSGHFVAENQFTGLFSLVTESDCYAEVEFLADGKGELRDICSAESASAKLSVIRTEFSWYQQAEKIIVSLPNSKMTFVYRASLSCSDFGYTGHSPGVVNEGMSYFKVPLDCK